MSTLTELLEAMRGKSLTQGWGAVVAYSRDKANSLLLQQTIERLQSSNRYIQPIYGEVALGDIADTRLSLTGLQLCAPVLSFESTQQRDRRATLRFPIESGMVVTTINMTGSFEQVVRVDQQLPLAQAMLTLNIDLRRSGGVTGGGSVFIELHEATVITSSFGDDERTRKAVAAFFERLFLSLDSTRRRYELGSLGDVQVPELTPESFEVRVVTRVPAASTSSPHFGDGAIELYVRFKGGEPGGIPGSSFPFLLPDGYSCSLLLSSRVLFDKVLRQQLQRDIGWGIRFADYTGGQDSAWPLKAVAGEFSAAFEYHYTVRNGNFDAVFYSPMGTTFGPEGSHEPLTVRSDGSRLRVTWKKSTSTRFERVIYWDWPSGEEWDRGTLHFSYDFSLGFTPVLRDDGVVAFRRDSDAAFHLSMHGHEWLPDLGDGDRSNINEVARQHFLPPVTAMFEGVKPPEVDTFIARNLLFPARNAFVPAQVHLPGDLLLVGQLDHPFVVKPDQPLLAGGGSLTFTTQPLQSGVSWSLAGVYGQQGGLGSIDSQGRYQAPAVETLVQGSMTVVVTASKGVGSAKTSVSTLLRVVREAVAVSPLLQVCEVEQTRTFSAFGLADGVFDATLDDPGNGGALVRIGDGEWRYTAGPKVSGAAVVLDAITVKSRNTGASKKTFVVVIHRVLALRIELNESKPGEGGSLRGFMDEEEISADEITWALVGDGQVDADGRYTPPAQDFAGVDLVTGSLGSGSRAHWGYLVIPRTYGYPKGLQARRDFFGTIYVSWDAMPGVVEYEAEGFERTTRTEALKCTWLLANMGIGPISLKGRYADGSWSAAIVIRFVNMPG